MTRKRPIPGLLGPLVLVCVSLLVGPGCPEPDDFGTGDDDVADDDTGDDDTADDDTADDDTADDDTGDDDTEDDDTADDDTGDDDTEDDDTGDDDTGDDDTEDDDTGDDDTGDDDTSMFDGVVEGTLDAGDFSPTSPGPWLVTIDVYHSADFDDLLVEPTGPPINQWSATVPSLPTQYSVGAPEGTSVRLFGVLDDNGTGNPGGIDAGDLMGMNDGPVTPSEAGVAIYLQAEFFHWH